VRTVVVLGLGAIATIVAIGFFIGQFVDLPLFQQQATMHPRAEVRGRTVNVAGTTDLPDGAIINYYFVHEQDAVNGNAPPGGLATVRDGLFEFETHLPPAWPSGKVTLYCLFGISWEVEQPKAVVDRFGSRGERLAGPQVYVDSPGDDKQLLATAELTFHASR
jgi:hypothetical protein